ncbi:DNA-binding transcriptional regulator, GntR family [Thermomonospora echinospora]|uniref:DNA-binding transcriptional regulator, GntR family n=1 Tax=Thermomonospora echinospora TaxID=1992 RepID=A0A1H6C8N0_9ACTN|nr:GntR family transcriptional regulator [Thermomonospora echinospora]SEG69339.1 DNA-binding transcriptional regulator, GntR family [Thermomonospora echinospora]
MSGDAEPSAGRPALAGKQLSEQVAVHLREAIMIGELRAPAYVRTEHLAAELGISATPVREALMILHSEGAVRWEPRRGFRVLPLTERDVDDLFNVQSYIAGELAARAATALGEPEIEHLRRIQARLERAARDGAADLVDALNHEIHRTINRSSGSSRMTALLNLTVHYVPLRFFGKVEGWAEASAHDHSAIFDALHSRDPEAARTAMTDHIRHVGRLLIDHLRSRGVLEEPPAPPK